MKKLGAILTALVISLSGCGAAGGGGDNSSEILSQSRLMNVVNDYYYYTLLYKHNLTTDASSRRVEGVKRVMMTAEGGTAIDVTSSVEAGVLTEAKLNELKVIHSLSDERYNSMKADLADTWYVDVNLPTIPEGTTKFEVTLRISGTSDETFTDTVELVRPAAMGIVSR